MYAVDEKDGHEGQESDDRAADSWARRGSKPSVFTASTGGTHEHTEVA